MHGHRSGILPTALVSPVLVTELWVAAASVGSEKRRSETPVPDAVASATSPLAGQWRGQPTRGGGRSAELVLDLGVVANRWTGQFDLHDFGVEDHPVDVALDGRRVTLHLTAAQIDCEGTLSVTGDLIGEFASTQEHRDSLLLKRAGEAQLSREFLELEKVAEDSSRVETLNRRCSGVAQAIQ